MALLSSERKETQIGGQLATMDPGVKCGSGLRVESIRCARHWRKGAGVGG